MAAWKQSALMLLMDILRVSIRVCLFIDGILLALFSIWFCTKFLLHTLNWLDRVMFGSYW